MTRGHAITGVLGLVALCALGCGDNFEEGRAKEHGKQGLKILDLEPGIGEQPIQDGDTVEVKYKGWVKATEKLIDDTTLRVTLGEGRPVPGFDEGLRGMKERGKRRIFVPPQLGYGDIGSGRDIPPNADLVYQVEIIKVERRPSFDDSKARAMPSGLKILDQKEGTGPGIQKGDRAQVHYTGWLRANGRKFDSSLDRGQPFTVTVGASEVIKGWDEGLLGAKAGGQRRLFIPADLGYGPRGSGRDIPPNADLVFDIEVVRIFPGQ